MNSIANYVSVGGASATPSAASSSKAMSDIRSTFSSTETLKAELLWTLQTVAANGGKAPIVPGYHSNDNIGALFTLMFPDTVLVVHTVEGSILLLGHVLVTSVL